MKYLKIKITGSGDKYMLAFSLNEIADLIKITPNSKLEKGVEWKDGIITTEISEIDDNKI